MIIKSGYRVDGNEANDPGQVEPRMSGRNVMPMIIDAAIAALINSTSGDKEIASVNRVFLIFLYRNVKTEIASTDMRIYEIRLK
ncbi:MAG: hypothetical protein JXA13_03355 [Anaerolineales bacterium]|nr:hypothetical protein [Anaerolineales bacterium]